MAKKQLKWEDIPQSTGFTLSRAPIFGGWLVHMMQDVRSPVSTGYPQPEYKEGYEWRTSITFVPDPKHEWNLETAYPHIPRTYL